nr:MAG TPA_asm: Glycine rich protein family [Caudoviricetes sp.]DAL50694.1 MAG TPA_asm: Glycine rich protein family [Caudoviricetes sp.]
MTSKFPFFLAIFVILLLVIGGVYSCSPTKTAVVEPISQSVKE